MEGQTSVVIPIVITMFTLLITITLLWYIQSQANRPTFDVVWGSQPSRPMMATGMSVAAATLDLLNPDGDSYSGAQHHHVHLDVPDVAF